jgi:hypothetical protein
MNRRAREAYVDELLDWALEDPPPTRTDIERCIRDAEVRVEHATSDLPGRETSAGLGSRMLRWLRGHRPTLGGLMSRVLPRPRSKSSRVTG